MKRTSNSLLILALIILSSIISVTFTSCSSDDDAASPDIIGSWYGTRKYNNPVSGTKYQYITITFNSDHSGTLEYESPVSVSYAIFSWSVSGSIITCRGAYADTYGDAASDFTMQIEIKGDRLYPLNNYSSFILTRNGDVITDGNGNETKNSSVKSIMASAISYWNCDDISTTFTSKNTVTYMETSPKKLGSFGYVSHIATGSNSCYWNVAPCNFEEVFGDYGDGSAADYLPGWTYGKCGWLIIS